MPKVKLQAPLPPAALTVPQIRVLQELRAGAWIGRQKIEERAGSAGAVAGLASLGLIIDREVDVEGAVEQAWGITDLGRQVADGSAAVGKDEADDGLRVGALAPWFGAARQYAAAVGEALRGCKWVGIPFCGGLSEVPAILAAGANGCGLNDKHRHLINLARVAGDLILGPKPYRHVRRQPFCAELLELCQRQCKAGEPGDEPDLRAACAYFVCAWMGRSAESGKKKEFDAGLAIRYGAGGGNSVLRCANACFSLRAWRKILERCSMSCDDGFDFLARCNDRPDTGIYVDRPWPVAGEAYLHAFTIDDDVRLAADLDAFDRARVVLRTSRDPQTDALYPAETWDWRAISGRNQANAVGAEYLVIRRGAEGGE